MQNLKSLSRVFPNFPLFCPNRSYEKVLPTFNIYTLLKNTTIHIPHRCQTCTSCNMSSAAGKFWIQENT